MDAGKQTDVILLDFSKAFDRVSHMCLCHKLHHLGINGSLLAWIKCFLSERIQRIIVNGQRSSPSVVLSGVPQGNVLGPLLFLCYINDIISSISSAIKLYANDVLIYRIIDIEDDCKTLQRDLDLLQTWALLCLYSTRVTHRGPHGQFLIMQFYNYHAHTYKYITCIQ